VRLGLLVLVALAACAHAPPVAPARPGPVCQGLAYPADAPCLEAGQPAPFGGILVAEPTARAWLAQPAKLEAENASLRRSVLIDVGLIVAAGLACGVAGYELGHALK
jgi:hypothetical protein